MSQEYFARIHELCKEDVKRRSLASPCYTCQFFRQLDLVGYSWVFKLPNPPNFANHETLHAWCIIEVLDRYPQPLYEGKTCSHWENRETSITLTLEHIKAFHPSFS